MARSWGRLFRFAFSIRDLFLALSPNQVGHHLVVLPKYSILRLQRRRAQFQLLYRPVLFRFSPRGQSIVVQGRH